MMHVRYLRSLLRHKWYVGVAGVRVGPSHPLLWPLWLLQLLVHDWSKFLPSEWGPYARKFYGGPYIRCAANVTPMRGDSDYPPKYDQVRVDREFDVAWLLHQNRQPHHWQFWILLEDNPELPRWTLAGTHQRESLYLRSRDRVGPRATWAKIGDFDMLGDVVADANRYRALPMPERFVREMVADWAGAGRAYTGAWGVSAWYAQNREKIVLHPEARRRVEQLLQEHFA